MSVSNTNNCYKCDSMFAELDTPIKCDGCITLVHNKCSGLTASELKCLTLKNRNLKYFCDSCSNGVREIPELKMLIQRLLTEVSELRNLSGKNSSARSDEFIINEINERNLRASNLILYNVPESSSTVIADKIAHDFNLVNDVINSIVSNETTIKPIKLIRLGKHGQNYSRPIKAIFGSPTEAFDILKSKKKLSFLQPPSTIGISSDRTIYQRNYMKSLREELESRRSKGEPDLIIKYVKGTPTIVSKQNYPSSHSENFLS